MPGVLFTLAEATQILNPPLTEHQLRTIIHALGWHPDGVRRTGRAGRPAATYDAAKLMRLHSALTPWIAGGRTCSESPPSSPSPWH